MVLKTALETRVSTGGDKVLKCWQGTQKNKNKLKKTWLVNLLAISLQSAKNERVISRKFFDRFLKLT